MCRMESSSAGPKGVSHLGRGWAGAFPVMQPPPQRRSGGQRRYKFEARLGKGRHQGTLYRARDEHGDVWAVEVVPQQPSSTTATTTAGGAKAGATGKKRKLKRRLSKLALGGGASAHQLQPEEEEYTDCKTGAQCYVSRLPRESMRQRLGRASYGLGTVLRWAKQLATAVVGSNGASVAAAGNAPAAGRGFGASGGGGLNTSKGSGLLGLDSLWLDDADCILVGDYRPSSYAMPPSSSYSYHTESEEDEEEDEAGMEEVMDSAAEERVRVGAKQRADDAAGVSPISEDGGAQESPSSPLSSPSPAPRVLEEEELKAFGVLLYQLATKTALPEDPAQAYAHIVARAEAQGDEASGRQALVALLRETLQQEQQQQQRGADARAEAGSERPRSEDLAPLAELIADALMGKPQLARDLLAAVPSPHTSRGPSPSPLPAGPVAEEMKAHHEQPQPEPEAVELTAAASMFPLAAVAVKPERPSSPVGTPSPVSAACLPSRQPSQQSLASLASGGSSTSYDSECPEPLRPILGALRQTGDAKLRHRALFGLKKLGAKAAEPAVLLALLAVLQDADGAQRDPVARRMAAWTLGSLGEAAAIMGAVPALIRALGDADARVRQAAAWALGGMGRACEAQGARATLLHRSVKDEDAQVRELAAQSLARLSRVTGVKRRRPADDAISSSEDASACNGGGAGPRTEAYYAKRRPISLASTTRCMAQASLDEEAAAAAAAQHDPAMPPLVPISTAFAPPRSPTLSASGSATAAVVPHFLVSTSTSGSGSGSHLGSLGSFSFGPSSGSGASFQLVHAPGSGQPVALAVAAGLPGSGLSPTASFASLSSASGSAGSSAVSSPTGAADGHHNPASASASAAPPLVYFIQVPVEATGAGAGGEQQR